MGEYFGFCKVTFYGEGGKGGGESGACLLSTGEAEVWVGGRVGDQGWVFIKVTEKGGKFIQLDGSGSSHLALDLRSLRRARHSLESLCAAVCSFPWRICLKRRASLMAEGFFIVSGFCPYLLAEVGGWFLAELVVEGGYFFFRIREIGHTICGLIFGFWGGPFFRKWTTCWVS